MAAARLVVTGLRCILHLLLWCTVSATLAAASFASAELTLHVAPGDGVLSRARQQIHEARMQLERDTVNNATRLQSTPSGNASQPTHRVHLAAQVHLAAGTFRLDETLVLGAQDSHTTWLGSGNGNTIIEVDHESSAAIHLHTASNVTLHGLSLRRRRLASTSVASHTSPGVCQMYNGTGALLRILSTEQIIKSWRPKLLGA
eukprot:COSAG02_NODE_156_length_33065_cov_17.208336_24_plen_202_part_00